MSSTKLSKPNQIFSEGSWQSGLPSPYYNKPSHAALREYVRQWTEDNLIPNSEKWDDDGAPDPALYQKFAKEGMLIPFALGVSIPERFYKMANGIKLPGGVPPQEWDNFHDFILIDELYRCGSNGAVMSSYGGLAYGAGPIVHFGGEELQNRMLPDLLQGKKRICLAITEPNAGSNVSNVQTSAVKSSDGKHYIVTGTKKWITNGIWADYFTTLVRTSGKAGDPKGLSLLVIPRTADLSTKKMKMQGAHASGTTWVEFDEVKVPVENLVGKEGEGFRYVMYNFNHERMTIAYVALRMARVSIEDAAAHARRREVFGQKLIEQPVVRNKLANMARETEALQAWTESLIYQQSKLSISESNRLTGGQTALLKAHAGIVLEKVNSQALQLMGGMGLTRGGAGERIERVWREIKGLTIPGGSEDVLLDLGVRQQLKLVHAKL